MFVSGLSLHIEKLTVFINHLDTYTDIKLGYPKNSQLKYVAGCTYDTTGGDAILNKSFPGKHSRES